jgi:hypothetical protein
MNKDRGELLKYEFTVMPGNNGTFVIRKLGSLGPGSMADVYGFTTIDDLLKFLNDEAVGFKSQSAPKQKGERP